MTWELNLHRRMTKMVSEIESTLEVESGMIGRLVEVEGLRVLVQT
jgi:hypothetical protein